MFKERWNSTIKRKRDRRFLIREKKKQKEQEVTSKTYSVDEMRLQSSLRSSVS